ncbi:MAG: T9SS type A sorting domain-containing protein [Bacteroidota bacterium]
MRVVALLAFLTFSAGSALAQPSFSKTFLPDQIGPGSVSTLSFRIDNSDFATPVTDIAFTDVLPAGVTIATPAVASTTCGGDRDAGPASLVAPDGGGTITFSGASVPGFSVCNVTVNVTSSTPGTYTNLSGDLTSSAGNSGTATDDLTVDANRPGFTKSFSPSTTTFGTRSRLTLTVDNTLNTNSAFRVQFTDELPTGLVIANPSAASTSCEQGTLSAPPGSSTISFTPNFVLDPTVGAGATCTVTVDVIASTTGQLENVTSELVAATTFSGIQQTSGKAGAILAVVPASLTLTKSFTNDPVSPGGTVGLEFTIRNLSRFGGATDIAFTDDLEATLAGLVLAQTPPSSVCNGGTLSFDAGVLSLSGGTLPLEGTCTFSVSLAVPGGTEPGTYPNVTSQVSAMSGGTAILGPPASDDLVVAAVPVLTKEFVDDPVTPGSPVTLRFGITNTSTTSSATALAFTDPIPFLGNPLIATLPSPGFCGPSSFIFTTIVGGIPTLQVQDVSLDAGASCSFDVILTVPEGTSGGSYTNTTDPISGTVDGATAVGNRATDDLVVLEGVSIAKQFTDAPVSPGGTVTLQFTLNAPSEGDAPNATAIAFTDDLDAVLTGLVSTSGTQADVCGTGSSLSGTSTLSFTGGTLAAGESCTFTATLAVPVGAAAGTYTNTTSPVSSTIDGNALTSPGATDDFLVTPILFSKDFTDDPVAPGSLTTLTFTIENTDATQSVSGLFFQDNLDAALDGMVSTSGTQTDVCGAASQLQGTTNLLLFGGSLGPSESCTFSVSVSIPGGVLAGTYSNVTSNLAGDLGGSGSGTLASPATADLVVVVDEPPAFLKAFSPAEILAGGVSTLTFTIDNEPNLTAATALDVTDVFPSGLVLATPANGSTTCTGGTLTAPGGGTQVVYTGGSVGAETSCTISVDVTASEAGSYENVSGDLTSSLGNSGSATATLTVIAPPEFVVTKDDQDASGDGLAAPGEVVTYIVGLTNTGGRADMALTFTDTPGANTTLVAGSVTTTAGSVVTGNTSGDTSVEVNAGILGPDATVTVTFDVLVTEEPPPGVEEVCNQGSATDGETTILSDDPDTPEANDPTCTTLDIPPPPVDLVITSVEAERGQPLVINVTQENTTFERIRTRLQLTIMLPDERTFVTRGLRAVLDPGELTEPTPAADPRVIPNGVPAGLYTGRVEVIDRKTREVVDVEEFEFTLSPLAPDVMASANLWEESALTVVETRLPEAGPNPFMGQTTFRYALAEAMDVSLRVYDVTGREVANLVSGEVQSGAYEVVFDARTLPAGVYLWRAVVGEEVVTGRVTLVR